MDVYDLNSLSIIIKQTVACYKSIVISTVKHAIYTLSLGIIISKLFNEYFVLCLIYSTLSLFKYPCIMDIWS